MSQPISQREARRLRKRVFELERMESERNSRWGTEYPGGVHIDTLTVNAAEWHIVRTARALGHAVIVVPDKEPTLRVYGVLPVQRGE